MLSFRAAVARVEGIHLRAPQKTAPSTDGVGQTAQNV
jgi:hypothetical protein